MARSVQFLSQSAWVGQAVCWCKQGGPRKGCRPGELVPTFYLVSTTTRVVTKEVFCLRLFSGAFLWFTGGYIANVNISVWNVNATGNVDGDVGLRWKIVVYDCAFRGSRIE